MTPIRRLLLVGPLAVAATALLAAPVALAHPRPDPKPTVILVHGAFADASVIPAQAQRFMAQRANAHSTEVNASHVAMISQPAATADLIKRAAR